MSYFIKLVWYFHPCLSISPPNRPEHKQNQKRTDFTIVRCFWRISNGFSVGFLTSSDFLSPVPRFSLNKVRSKEICTKTSGYLQVFIQDILSGHFGDWGKPEGGLPPEGDNPNPENPNGFVLLFGTWSPANNRMERFHFQRKHTNKNADHRSSTVLGKQNTTAHLVALNLVGKTFSPQEVGRGQGELYFL